MISISSPLVSKYNSINMVQKSCVPSFCAADVSELILKGDNALNSNKPEEAILAYQEALQKNINEIDTYRKLGKAYVHAKDYNGAISAYSEYLSKNDKSDEAWIELGEAQRLKGQYQQAINSFEKALAISPNNDLAKRSIQEAKNNLLSIYSPAQAQKQRDELATKNLGEALQMTVAYLSPEYMKEFADVKIIFGKTASMGGTDNIAQYEDHIKTMTVSEKYKYAPPQLIAAYLVHESVHAHDKDPYTSVREEQDAYKIATEFWIANSKGVEDPEMDYAASLYKQSPSVLADRVAEIYKQRDPDIAMTSPNHPPKKKSFFKMSKSKAASQPLKQYQVIA